MSFDEGNLVTDQSRFCDSGTNAGEAQTQGQSEQCAGEKPVTTDLLYEALFTAGETSRSQDTDGATEITVQKSESLSWANRSHHTSTGAESQEWSSFSDISNAISPAASNDSVAVSWKETESDSDMLTTQGQSEVAPDLNGEEAGVTALSYQFDPTTYIIAQMSSTASTGGVSLGDYTQPAGDAADVIGSSELNKEDAALTPQISVGVAHIALEGHPPVEGQQERPALSNECFEAAVTERMKRDWKGKLSKVKQMKENRRCQHSYNDAVKLLDSHHFKHQQEQQKSQSSHQIQLSQHSSQIQQLPHALQNHFSQHNAQSQYSPHSLQDHLSPHNLDDQQSPHTLHGRFSKKNVEDQSAVHGLHSHFTPSSAEKQSSHHVFQDKFPTQDPLGQVTQQVHQDHLQAQSPYQLQDQLSPDNIPDRVSPHCQNGKVSLNTTTYSSTTLFPNSSLHCVSDTSMSIYVSPKSPSTTSASSGDRSDGSVPKLYGKKYRYNQTAAALQKSGLFKTTMKTAELLQRNRVLQQELQKLRRETMLFMHSVLSNPENSHLRKLYINSDQEIS